LGLLLVRYAHPDNELSGLPEEGTAARRAAATKLKPKRASGNSTQEINGIFEDYMSTTSQRLRKIEIELHRTKTKLRKLLETVEDLDDLLALEKAKAENGGKPPIPWEIVAKELGIHPPPKKRPRKVRSS
jgi:hypothetical protein